jgi:hypothetical protein
MLIKSLNPSLAYLRNWIWRHWGVFCFGLLSLVSFVVVVFLGPRYQVNDDATIRAFADGSYTGSTESELVFVGKPIGIMLSALYDFSPLISWYDFVLLGTNLLSFMLLSLLLKVSWGTRVGWVFLVATIFTYLIHSPTYTSTAIVSAGIGVGGLVFTALIERRMNYTFFWSLLVFISGICWRFEALAPALIFGVFLFLAMALIQRMLIRNIFISLVLCFGFLGASSLAVSQINNMCFGKEIETCQEWKAWKEYNSIRGSFHVSPRGVIASEYATTGQSTTWSESETTQFLNWMYFDEAVHGSEQIKIIDSEVPNSPLPGYAISNNGFFQSLLSGVPSFILAISPPLASVGHWVIVAFFLTSAKTIYRSRRLASHAAAHLLVALGSLMTLYLASGTRLPNHVSIPVIALWAVGFVFLAAFSLRMSSSDSTRRGFSSTNEELFLALISYIVPLIFTVLVIFNFGLGSIISQILLACASVIISISIVTAFMGSTETARTYASRLFSFFSAAIVVLYISFHLVGLGPKSIINASDLPRVYSEKVQAPWSNVLLWGSGSTGGEFTPLPYAFGERPDMGRVSNGGWPTFSPHWYMRHEYIGSNTPSVEGFLTGEIFFLGSESDFAIFSNLDIFTQKSVKWLPLGSYFEGSGVSVWRILPEQG